MMPLTSPQPLFLFHAAVSTTQITPLPQCGRGTGGEGYPRTLPLPLEAYPKYPVVEADRLRYSGAAPVHQDTLVGIWCHLVPSGNFCGIR
jgi:hypothetical protein